MRQMTSDLEKENLLVFIDRAGYGFSEDTNKDLTNANIVEDYRLVLKNLEINGVIYDQIIRTKTRRFMV